MYALKKAESLLVRQLYRRIFIVKNDPPLSETNNNKANNPEIIYYLERLVNDFPGCIYWKNRNGHYLGCSQYYVIIFDHF